MAEDLRRCETRYEYLERSVGMNALISRRVNRMVYLGREISDYY